MLLVVLLAQWLLIRQNSFTFYLSKAEQYTSGQVQNVGCVYYCCCLFQVERTSQETHK